MVNNKALATLISGLNILYGVSFDNLQFLKENFQLSGYNFLTIIVLPVFIGACSLTCRNF